MSSASDYQKLEDFIIKSSITKIVSKDIYRELEDFICDQEYEKYTSCGCECYLSYM